MAYRVSPSELGYYEDERWTEQPYEYLRRALERELFERRHLRRIVTGAADTLDVELTAFEELRTPAPHVRLALTYVLHDQHESVLEQSVAIERSLPPGTDANRPERVAEALGAALGDAVTRISDAVTEDLRAASAPSAPSDAEAAPPSREASRPARGR
jgi:cholesterol transport system auxiliary component